VGAVKVTKVVSILQNVNFFYLKLSKVIQIQNNVNCHNRFVLQIVIVVVQHQFVIQLPLSVEVVQALSVLQIFVLRMAPV
jgi:hypothetical protein